MEDVEFKKALQTAANLLSRRSHSKKDLKEKLLSKYHSELVDKVLNTCLENKWLESETELSEKLAQELHKKNKSWFYMKNYFYKKGLPLPEYDRDKEVQKAQSLISKKFGEDLKPDTQKIKQFLSYRGFSEDLLEDIL